MLSKDYKVLIIALKDPRKRYRFILNPLQAKGVDVDVFTDDTSAIQFVLKSLAQLRIRGGYTHILVFGGNIKNLLWCLIARLMRSQCLVRLGGNPLEAGQSKLVLYKKNNSFFSIGKFYINHYSSKLLLKNANKIIVVNECIANELSTYIDCKVSVIPQFVDVPEIAPKSIVAGSVINCLCVTNLSYKEKAESLITIVGHLQAYCVSQVDVKIALSIAGGGEFEELVQDFLDKLSLPLNLEINFHGYVVDVGVLYSKAEIFLYASDLDATPNSILEAKSYALPIIVNNAAQFSTIFSEEKTRLFFDLNSKDSFKQHMNKLVRDGEWRKEVGILNRQEIVDYYSQNVIADSLLEVLRN